MRLGAVAGCAALVVWSASSFSASVQSGEESPYLFLFAGDQDEAESDFLAVVDVRADSPTSAA